MVKPTILVPGNLILQNKIDKKKIPLEYITDFVVFFQLLFRTVLKQQNYAIHR